MPFPSPSAIVLSLALGSAFAADQGDRIEFKTDPFPADSQAVRPSIPLMPPALSLPSLLEKPSLPPSLFTLQPEDSRGAAEPFDFQEYWARVEKENGIDELRLRMGMLTTDSRVPRAGGPGNPGLNLLGAGMLLYQAWKAQEDKATRERRFRMRVSGLIDLACRLEDRQGAAPGISIIVAKLDFMGKKLPGKLPDRPERRRFTENLKAWAVNPVFDSTGLGPALMEVCRLYEEYEP